MSATAVFLRERDGARDEEVDKQKDEKTREVVRVSRQKS